MIDHGPISLSTAPASTPITTASPRRPWWRDAVIYQVYVRSFAGGGSVSRDSSGAVGNLAGVRARLRYLADLGIDAIWFNPWYPSPMADAGYDVADYRSIEPLFGTLDDAELLIAEAHELGIRIIVDIVPNHGSDQHHWFQEALAAGPGSRERARFHFGPGRGESGELPPNDWQSIFGGPAWTRTTDADGEPGEWYLHLFAPEQPDFNWDNEDVRAEFRDVLRFWLDRGVDGFRIDSAALLVKDLSHIEEPAASTTGGDEHPYIDRSDVHAVYRDWRSVSDSYQGERVLIGEIWLPDQERFARYLRPDEMHSAFNFDFLCCAWDAAELRRVIDATFASHAGVGAPPTWVLNNHDVVRHVTRYGRDDTSFDMSDRRIGVPTDLALGTRRARAAALLSLSLPGGVYIYQGEELGLWEVENLPDEVRQDPIWHRSGHTDPGRDGCRVPLPWSGERPPFGFTDGAVDAATWLPQPAEWSALTVEAQQNDASSMLSLYRAALGLRRAEPAFSSEELAWVPAGDDVLCYRRGSDVTVLINLSAAPIELPPGAGVMLCSGELTHGLLPPDTGVWLRTSPPAP